MIPKQIMKDKSTKASVIINELNLEKKQQFSGLSKTCSRLPAKNHHVHAFDDGGRLLCWSNQPLCNKALSLSSHSKLLKTINELFKFLQGVLV